MVNVNIEISEEIAEQLRPTLGNDFATAFKEALAVEGYRSGQLSIGQVAELLGISTYEAEGLMTAKGVPAEFTVEQFERDQENLNRVLGK